MNTQSMTLEPSFSDVLYVDDEVENLTVFKSQFRKFFSILTATSASEGLDLIERNRVRVVVSDQRMPGMTGVQLLEEIKEKYPSVVRIILTAYTDANDIIDAINKGGVYHFMRKPWNSADLKAMIQKSLTFSEEQQQLTEAGTLLANEKNIISNHTKNILADECRYVVAKFPSKLATISSLFAADREFRALCMDYQLSNTILQQLDKESQRDQFSEYEELVQSLEREIVEVIQIRN